MWRCNSKIGYDLIAGQRHKYAEEDAHLFRRATTATRNQNQLLTSRILGILKLVNLLLASLQLDWLSRTKEMEKKRFNRVGSIEGESPHRTAAELIEPSHYIYSTMEYRYSCFGDVN